LGCILLQNIIPRRADRLLRPSGRIASPRRAGPLGCILLQNIIPQLADQLLHSVAEKYPAILLRPSGRIASPRRAGPLGCILLQKNIPQYCCAHPAG
jgi:hypothetical protein